MEKSNRWVVLLILAGAFLATTFAASYYTDWLWFRELRFEAVFWRMLEARYFCGILFGLLAALIIFPNLLVAGRFTRHALRVGGAPWNGEEIPGESLLRSKVGYLMVGAVLVLIMGNIGAAQWPMFLRYFHAKPFGISDPIFGRDVGFYVFSLPFYDFVCGFLIGAIVLSALVVGLTYAAAGGIRFQEGFEILPRPLAHVSALGGAFLLALAWKYRLKIYGLLFSQGKTFFGAGYVDVNVQVWTYWLLVLVFLGAAGLAFANVRSRGGRLPLTGVGLLLGGAIAVGAVPSALVQKLVVDPSELAKEKPYIKYNIEATNHAYGLDKVDEKPFAAADSLSWEDLDANPQTIQNIRLWDERPLKQTYQQEQEIRPYYTFNDVDVDRYMVNGVYTQVMLAAREMDTSRLPAQARNWVNERLQYTHGYGVVLSPVNRMTTDGLPEYLVKDIPPVTKYPSLKVKQPAIYYGERSYGDVVVKTRMQEFDYPSGNENKYTTYDGTGGVPIGGFFRRLLFTARFTDINLLLSSYITSQSRIMFRRQIMDRVQTLAPFLYYDSNPYIVLYNGKLYWMIDAYTTSDMYPYSARSGRAGINYIRNSVKVVVDAYNGSVTFYRMNLKDPIIAAYAEIFPTLFRPVSDMPAGLRAHIRYPIDLFRIQAARYRDYHMRDVQVFYNQEDMWAIPNEIYKDQAQMMDPYYIIIRLPGEAKEEYLLMVPFTPVKKDNMIAWMAARCDGSDYGHLLVYQLPKDKLIYGPMQVEAQVDQEPDISSQLTLWGQRGSEVIRGNLMVIPIANSFLYVEPVYLQARQESSQPQFSQQGQGGGPGQQQGIPSMPPSTAIPELQQVIVDFGGQVVMRKTLDEALIALFGKRAVQAPLLPQEAAVGPMPRRVAPAGVGVLQSGEELAAQAQAHYQQVRKALQAWDWARAGVEMKSLEKTLNDLKKTLGGGK